MLEWLKGKVEKVRSPILDWVQVEVTTYCNGSCIYCPHTLMRNRWVERHMPMELFDNLVPYLRFTDLVYLQGWGEPLLHNDFFEMVRICKDLGKRVGFTTNGMLLSEKRLQKLVDTQVDILGVSLAGTTAKTHERIRKGSNFDDIISRLEQLHKVKGERKTRVPAVHLAYLMLKSNFDELKEILRLAQKVGAEQIVASNLTLILDPSLSAEVLFHDTQQIEYYRSTLEDIRHKASRANIVFDYHGLDLDNTSVRCRENVYRACVMNVEGEVVPCVLANPVLCKGLEHGHGESACHIFEGQSIPLTAMSFGNLRDESLTRIWNKEEYSRFRDVFDPQAVGKPEQIRPKMPERCAKCYKSFGV